MYKAKVITVLQLRKHPNADKLQLLDYNGMQFVVGLDVEYGDEVILFPVDGKLSHEMLSQNNLYRDAARNCDKLKSGFFDDNGKVRAQKFRGEISQGFVAGIDTLSWTGANLLALDSGMEFDTINGKLICEKYETSATRRARSGKKIAATKGIVRSIHKHYDTENLAYNIDKLPDSGLVIISEKIHGSSGVTGFVKVEHEYYPWYAFINSIARRRLVKPRIHARYERISLTRNTVVNDREDCINPDGSDYYRWQIHNWNNWNSLREGETVYYEIVGFTHTGAPIMNSQDTARLKDKEVEKRWGKQITYSYGCSPETELYKIHVYRITQQNESGDVVELPWFQVEQRCKELGLNTVPVLDIHYYNQDLADSVLEKAQHFTLDNSSVLDERHLREGICARIESSAGIKVYKLKNKLFLVLEGVAKEDDTYVDTEEVN